MLRRLARALPVAALLALLAWAGWCWGPETWAVLRDEQRLEAWLTRFGPWAPAASVVLGALKPLAPFLPGQALAVANGWLFGFGRGLLVGYAGLLLGSLLVLALARRWGRPLVARFVPAARMTQVDAFVQRRGGPFFFLVFLLPLTPDDLACWALGLSRLPLARMFGLLAVARLPGVVVASWLGAHAGQLSPAGWAALGAGGVAAVLLYVLRRRWLEALVWRWLERAGDNGP